MQQYEIIGKSPFCYKIDFNDKLRSGAFGAVYGCTRVDDVS